MIVDHIHHAAEAYRLAAGLSRRALSLLITPHTNLLPRLKSGRVTATTLQAVVDYLLTHPVEGWSPPDWLVEAGGRGPGAGSGEVGAGSRPSCTDEPAE